MRITVSTIKKSCLTVSLIVLSVQILSWCGVTVFYARLLAHVRDGDAVDWSSKIFPEGPGVSGFVSDRISEQLAFVPQKLSSQPVIIYQPVDMPTVPLGFYEFQQKNCLVRNCFLTTVERHKEYANVIFFNPRTTVSLEHHRPPTQIWILQLLESPENTDSLAAFNGKINYTASYRLDSDIVTPYSKWLPREHIASSVQSVTTIDYAQGKTRKVAWFVSHCITNNRRREYALQLSTHIQVDVFGECGDFRISKTEGPLMLKKHYKFYLSFENSNCRDYVTEKLFENALQNNVIPIVMGPPKSFYMRIAPEHSFIHVDDFSGPRELASYLHVLDADDARFNEYFTWKRRGRFVDTRFWCRVCAMVQMHRRKVYQDVDAWWHTPNDCRL